MMGLITESRRKARKSYMCDAYALLSNYAPDDLLDASLEQDAEFAAKVHRAMGTPHIIAGNPYMHYSGRGEDGFFTFRANLEADEVCRAFDLYGGG